MPSARGLYEIRTKRAYEAAVRQDGQRILVDAMWPRGISKSDLDVDAWLKEIAPSKELRQWFGHDPGKWPEFCDRFAGELAEKPEPVRDLLDRCRQGRVTLVYAASDSRHNNAVALKSHLEAQAG